MVYLEFQIHKEKESKEKKRKYILSTKVLNKKSDDFSEKIWIK